MTVRSLWLGVALAAFGAGCASAPSTFESKFFDIETNLVARVMVVTNVAPAHVTNSSVEFVTNSEALVVPVTNTTVSMSFQTNRAVVTNLEEEILYTPNDTADRIGAVAGRTAGLFTPFGELIGVLIGGALGLWGWMRSKRAVKTAGILAQIIETGRQILQTTPQGRSLDNEWKAWMIKHQAEHGVILEVLRLIESTVDTPTAKETAAKLLALMQGTAPLDRPDSHPKPVSP